MNKYTVVMRRDGRWACAQVHSPRIGHARRPFRAEGFEHIGTVRGHLSHQGVQALVDRLRRHVGDIDAIGKDVRYIVSQARRKKFGVLKDMR